MAFKTTSRLYAMTLMAMKTGARRGELLALTWRDVDLNSGIASLGRTKNGDRRTLVLLADVVEALTPFKSSDLDRFVFGSVRSKYQVPTSIDSAWRDAVDRAKIKNFKFHDLRHCCASYMAQAGIPFQRARVGDSLSFRALLQSMGKDVPDTMTEAEAAAVFLREADRFSVVLAQWEQALQAINASPILPKTVRWRCAHG